MENTFALWLSTGQFLISKIDPTIVLSILLVIPAYWSAMISRNTAKRQLRAYVSIGTDDLRLEKETSLAKWVINFSYKNNGSTPAYYASIATGHILADREDITTPLIRGAYALGTIGPTDRIYDVEETRVSDDDVELLKTGEKVLIFYGRLEYTDAFKKKRCTNFRFFTGGTAPYLDQSNPDMTIYVKGNDSN